MTLDHNAVNLCIVSKRYRPDPRALYPLPKLYARGVKTGIGPGMTNSTAKRTQMPNLIDAYHEKVSEGVLKSDPVQMEMLPHFERIRAALANPAPQPKRGWFRKAVVQDAPKGLYLWGGVGRGKSMLMDLFVEQLNVPAKRVHFHAFMQEVQTKLHKLRADNVTEPLIKIAEDVAAESKVFAFDEMQITDIADAMVVGQLFDKLFEVGCVVVTTSNRVPKDLYKDGLNRQLFLPFIDLIQDRMDVVEMTSDTDHRQGRLEGQQVYFAPAGPEATQQINALWSDLAKGDDASFDLHVKGRVLTLPRYHNGMARCTFYDLCGAMLGPADYLALADHLLLLVLEDIPNLSRNNFNEAKRFVTLIDALYESGTKLIVSAADEPEMLYLEGRGSFEFERTASRLREMQSASWGMKDL